MVVANKIDLLMDYREDFDESNHELLMEEGYTLTRKIGACAYVECSAKLNDGVWEVFETAAKAVGM